MPPPNTVKGILLSKRWFSFMRLIYLSTCILRLAISSVLLHLAEVNGLFPCKNGGMFNDMFFSDRSGFTRNPLSAMTLSPSSNRSKIPPVFVVISRYLIYNLYITMIQRGQPHGGDSYQALECEIFIV